MFSTTVRIDRPWEESTDLLRFDHVDEDLATESDSNAEDHAYNSYPEDQDSGMCYSPSFCVLMLSELFCGNRIPFRMV
jgi:hypothetical protein